MRDWAKQLTKVRSYFLAKKLEGFIKQSNDFLYNN